MKKILFLTLALMLFLSTVVCSFAEGNNADTFVYDKAGLLTESEEAILSEKLAAISQSFNAQVTLVTLSSSIYSDIYFSAENTYRDLKLGYGANRDGVLLLVCMDIREYYIYPNGFVEEALPGEYIDKICDGIDRDLPDDNYFAAFNTYAEKCEFYLNGYVNGFPFDFQQSILISLGIGAAVGLIVVLILKAQLKSVRKNNHANAYVKDGSMHITHARDFFLYSRVSKTPKQTDSSSSSGGSSRKGGGRSF